MVINGIEVPSVTKESLLDAISERREFVANFDREAELERLDEMERRLRSE